MADLSAKVKHLEDREKVILHRLRMKGCLAKALDNDRSQLVEALKTANSLIKALNDELDLQKQSRRRKTQRAEEPRKKTRLAPSAPFMSIGQMVWDTMMHFFYGNWSLHGNALIHEDSMVMQLTPDDIHETLVNRPEPDSDDAALCRFFEDQNEQSPRERTHSEPPVAQDMDWISTADPPPESPPGLQRGPEQSSVTFNIGDDSVDQSSMRRSSLEDTFGDMDWSAVLAESAARTEKSLVEAENIIAEVEKSLDEEDHARSLQTISSIADEAKEKKRLDLLAKKKRFLDPDSVICMVNGKVVRVKKRLLDGKTPVALKSKDPESVLRQEKILEKVAAAAAREEASSSSNPVAKGNASKIGKILIAQKMNDTPICVQSEVFEHLQKEGTWPEEKQKTYFFDKPPTRPKIKTMGEVMQEEAEKEVAATERVALCGCTNAANPFHTCAPRCVEVGCNGRCLNSYNSLTSES